MKQHIIGPALALCLLLTACGGREEEHIGGSRASVLARAAEMEDETVLLTVEGREIPAWRYLYWLAYACDRIREQYDRAGLPVEWHGILEEQTLADYAAGQALADTVLYATVEDWAETYGVTAGERTPVPMPETGLPQAQMAELEQVGLLYAGLYELFCAEGSVLAPEEEELARFAREEGWLTVAQLRIPWEGDREAARQRAEELFARLNGAADQAGEFSALGADGPITLRAGDGALEPALESAALALEEGQCSGILETGACFVLLRRLEVETGPAREAYFDHLLQSAAADADVSRSAAYEELDAARFYERLEYLRAE